MTEVLVALGSLLVGAALGALALLGVILLWIIAYDTDHRDGR